MSETLIQQAFVFAMNYRRRVDSRFSVIAIPNGGKRSIKTAVTMKKEGARAGVWDLLLLEPAHGYGGLWLETKTAKGTLSEEQIRFYEENKGKYKFSVYRDARIGIQLVEEYLKNGFGNYAGGTGSEKTLVKLPE